VRQSIRRQVVKPYLNSSGELPGYFLDPASEQAIETSVEHADSTSRLNLPPQRAREILDRITRFAGASDNPIVLLTTSGARFFLRQMAEASAPNLTVLSHNEVPNGVKILSLGLMK
jgi:flagellar biosynthesis protein FlhA